MAKITISYDVTGCVDCPQLTRGRTFGNDGRDGSTVYICGKGAFGSKRGGFCGTDEGMYSIPDVPPIGCPYIKADVVDRVASRLNIDSGKLRVALNAEQCKIVDK